MASAWRGTSKVSAFGCLSEWEITPTDHQKKQRNMTRADVLAFTQARVAALLRKDAFCDDGTNLDVSVYYILLLVCRWLKLQGQVALYNHPAFHTFIIKFFYGHNGIAVKYPEKFSTIFPIAALAFSRSILRFVLEENKTGTHVTCKLDQVRQKKYFVDLDIAMKLVDPNIDRYHPKIIEAICIDIASRGQWVFALYASTFYPGDWSSYC